MKKYFLIISALYFQTLIFGSDLSVDPQRDDANLQEEQTHDIQFEEDKNLQQERSDSFKMDPMLPP